MRSDDCRYRNLASIILFPKIPYWTLWGRESGTYARRSPTRLGAGKGNAVWSVSCFVIHPERNSSKKVEADQKSKWSEGRQARRWLVICFSQNIFSAWLSYPLESGASPSPPGRHCHIYVSYPALLIRVRIKYGPGLTLLQVSQHFGVWVFEFLVMDSQGSICRQTCMHGSICSQLRGNLITDVYNSFGQMNAHKSALVECASVHNCRLEAQ